MENQELKIRIYHPEEEAFGNSDVRINHCAPAGRSSQRTPSCGPLRAEAPARAAPRCRRALEYLSHRLFCCPFYRSARGRRKMLSEPAETRCSPPHRAAADCRSSINGMNNHRCAERTTDSAVLCTRSGRSRRCRHCSRYFRSAFPQAGGLLNEKRRIQIGINHRCAKRTTAPHCEKAGRRTGGGCAVENAGASLSA